LARKRTPSSSTPSYKAEAGADFGPGLRLDRAGRLVSWGGAALVEVENRDDPDISSRRRIVRGARRSDTLAQLEQRKVITKRMRDAAERFLDDCSIASGGAASYSVGMPRGSGVRAGLPERQVKAITRINQVRHLLGLNSRTVFWAVVFENVSLRDFEVSQRIRNGTAQEMLRAAMTALDNHYHAAPDVGRVAANDKHRWPDNIRA
jgi:hypothetical protein